MTLGIVYLYLVIKRKHLHLKLQVTSTCASPLPGWEKPEMGCIRPVGGAPLEMGGGRGGGDTPTGSGGSGGKPDRGAERGGRGGMPGRGNERTGGVKNRKEREREHFHRRPLSQRRAAASSPGVLPKAACGGSVSAAGFMPGGSAAGRG